MRIQKTDRRKTEYDFLKVTILEIQSNNSYTVLPTGSIFAIPNIPSSGGKFSVGETALMAVPYGNLNLGILMKEKVFTYLPGVDTLCAFFQNYGLYRYNFSGGIKNIFRYLKVIKFNPPSSWQDITNNVIAGEEWTPFEDGNTELYIGNLYQYPNIHVGLSLLGTPVTSSFRYWDAVSESWELSSFTNYSWDDLGVIYLADIYNLNCKKVLYEDFQTPYYWIQCKASGATDCLINDLYWEEERDVEIIDGIPARKKVYYLGGTVDESLAQLWVTKEINKQFLLTSKVSTNYPSLPITENIPFKTKSRDSEKDYWYITQDDTEEKVGLYHLNGKTGAHAQLEENLRESAFGGSDFTGISGFCYCGGYLYIAYTKSSGGVGEYYETIKTFEEAEEYGTFVKEASPQYPEGHWLQSLDKFSFEESEKAVSNPDWDEEHFEYIEDWAEPPGSTGKQDHRCIPELTVWLKRYDADPDTWFPFWSFHLVYENEQGWQNMEDPKYHYVAISLLIKNWYNEIFKMEPEDEIRILHQKSYSPGTPSYWLARYNLAEGILDMNVQMNDSYSYLKSNYAGDRLWAYSYEFDMFQVFDLDLVPKGTYQYNGQDEADFNDYCFDKNENMWIGYTESVYGGDTYYIIGFYGLGHGSEGQEIRRWEIPEALRNICVF